MNNTIQLVCLTNELTDCTEQSPDQNLIIPQLVKKFPALYYTTVLVTLSGIDCYHSVQDIFSASLRSRNVKNYNCTFMFVVPCIMLQYF